jgi:hypothetical protein
MITRAAARMAKLSDAADFASATWRTRRHVDHHDLQALDLVVALRSSDFLDKLRARSPLGLLCCRRPQ